MWSLLLPEVSWSEHIQSKPIAWPQLLDDVICCQPTVKLTSDGARLMEEHLVYNRHTESE